MVDPRDARIMKQTSYRLFGWRETECRSRECCVVHQTWAITGTYTLRKSLSERSCLAPKRTRLLCAPMIPTTTGPIPWARGPRDGNSPLLHDIVMMPVSWLDHVFLSAIGLISKNPGPEEFDELGNFTNIEGLKSIYININRLRFKVPRLRQFLHELKCPTICAVSETWLEAQHSSELLKIRGYTLHRFDRAFKHRTKGMALYVSNDIEHSKPVCYRELDFTLIHTTITYQKSKYTLAYVYRPPHKTVLSLERFKAKFAEKISQLPRNHPLIFSGDVNFNLSPRPSPDAERLIDILDNNGLDQVLTKPTRIQPPSATLVDWLAIDYTTVFPHTFDVINYQPHLSDHNCIGVLLYRKDLPRSGHKHTFEEIYDLTKYDQVNLLELLRGELWNEVYIADDINLKYAKFEEIVSKHLHATCPKRKVRTCDCPDSESPDKNRAWYNDDLKERRQQLDFLFRQMSSSVGTNNQIEAQDFYKQAKKDYESRCFKARKKFYVDTLKSAKAERNSKKTAKVVSRLTGKGRSKTTIAKLQTANGTFTKPIEIANIFGKYFAEVGLESSEAADTTLPDTMNFPTNPPHMGFHPPGVLATHRKLTKIDDSKPPGPGGIPGKFFKEFADQLVFVLEHIFHHCVIRSCIPSAWKHAYVSPIYKQKGEKSDPYNYRPIAITPIISKIFEGLICDQLVKHLEDNRLLSETQYGYRKGRSTFHAVAHLTRQIRELSDSNRKIYVGVLFLDLSKAFDCVNHSLLSQMLPRFGLDENSVRLIKSYLSDRKQRVKLSSNVISDLHDLLCGVPQGSLIGPILFDLYINALSGQIDAIISQYADDTAVIRSSESINVLTNRLASDLVKLVAFFKSIGLLLNVSKTDFLLFGYNGPGDGGVPSINIPGQQPILPSEDAKYLGIIIDSKLSFDAQNQAVINRLKAAAATIKTIRSNITKEVAMQLLHTLFYSRYDYCSLIWSQDENSNLSKKLETQHRYALRIVLDSKLNRTPLYDLADAITLYQRNLISCAKLVYNFLSDKLPTSWNTYLLRPRLDIGRGAGEGRLRIPDTVKNTAFILRCLRIRIPKLWNDIPSNIRRDCLKAGTIKTFSKNMSRFLRSQTIFHTT